MSNNWKCPFCHNTKTENIFDTIETNIDGETLVINNIPAKQCTHCKEIFHNKKAGEYIDQQIATFKILKNLRIVKQDNKYYIQKAE